jgi:site-specific DNA-methyltransferase (adenine-specific)
VTAEPPWTLLTGAAETWLPEIPDETIPLVITSPPYGNLRAYGNGPQWSLAAFERIAVELARVLTPGGVICWVVGDQTVDGGESLDSFRQALAFQELGLRCHDTMIYQKLNFSAPSSNRYHQMFEFVFIFSKGAPRTFNPIKDKPNIYAGKGTFGKNTKRAVDGAMKESKRNVITENGQRGNVWLGKTAGQEYPCQPLAHPARMPEWLAYDLLCSWSNPEDIVLDPMAGEATTGVATVRRGQPSILIELNPDYAALAEARLQREWAKCQARE